MRGPTPRHDTLGNYLSAALGNYLSDNPSDLGIFMIADSQGHPHHRQGHVHRAAVLAHPVAGPSRPGRPPLKRPAYPPTPFGSTHMTPHLLRAALAAAERGWHVFPLTPNTKRPAVRGWEHRATTDPTRITRCWTTGRYGVGIACGPSGLLVLDLDMPKTTPTLENEQNRRSGTGADALAALAAQHGQPYPHDTYTVATASGGRHLYFQTPAGASTGAAAGTWRNTAGRLDPLIDTRAAGGYVVGAGSTVHQHPYVVMTNTEPAMLPGWLAALLSPPSPVPVPAGPVRIDTDRHSAYLAAAIRAEVTRVRNEPHNHNGALYIAACALGQLLAGGALTDDEVRRVLLDAYAPHIAAEPHHHNEREAHNTITSGLRAGAKRPRNLARQVAA